MSGALSAKPPSGSSAGWYWFSTPLTWADSAAPGAVDLTYNAIRSTSPDGFASATCVAHALDNAAADSEVPEGLFYYLVQVENDCGVTAGTTTADESRATVTCP